jgi:hypothetical protein
MCASIFSFHGKARLIAAAGALYLTIPLSLPPPSLNPATNLSLSHLFLSLQADGSVSLDEYLNLMVLVRGSGKGKLMRSDWPPLFCDRLDALYPDSQWGSEPSSSDDDDEDDGDGEEEDTDSDNTEEAVAERQRRNREWAAANQSREACAAPPGSQGQSQWDTRAPPRQRGPNSRCVFFFFFFFFLGWVFLQFFGFIKPKVPGPPPTR